MCQGKFLFVEQDIKVVHGTWLFWEAIIKGSLPLSDRNWSCWLQEMGVESWGFRCLDRTLVLTGWTVDVGLAT